MLRVGNSVATAAIFGVMATTAPSMGTAQVQNSISSSPSQYSGIPVWHRPLVPEHKLMMLNELRQERLVTDSAKLLQLATELKTSIDKSTVNQVPLQLIRQTEDIEKLAHDVKQQMRG